MMTAERTQERYYDGGHRVELQAREVRYVRYLLERGSGREGGMVWLCNHFAGRQGGGHGWKMINDKNHVMLLQCTR